MMQKVSVSLTQTVFDDETATSELSIEAVVSKNIITSFEHNQAPAVQLCHVRAHNRKQQDIESIFGGLAGGTKVVTSRPHAYSMQPATVSDLKSCISLNRMGSCKGSPVLQPTPYKVATVSSHAEDVRSLLYCASDSDEIESLVFNQAEINCIDEEEVDEEPRSDKGALKGSQGYGYESEESWSTEQSRHLASAFDVDFTLGSLTYLTAAEPEKPRVHYNNWSLAVSSE